MAVKFSKLIDHIASFSKRIAKLQKVTVWKSWLQGVKPDTVCEFWSATLDCWREIFLWFKNERKNDLWPNLANLLVVLFWHSSKSEIGTIWRLLFMFEIGGVSLAFQYLVSI